MKYNRQNSIKEASPFFRLWGGDAAERLFIYRKDASDPERKDDIIGWGRSMVWRLSWCSQEYPVVPWLVVPGVVLVKKLIGIAVAPTDVIHGQLPQLQGESGALKHAVNAGECCGLNKQHNYIWF